VWMRFLHPEQINQPHSRSWRRGADTGADGEVAARQT
jgi:hypothetical protein